jgi:effector-binding domain-containing protein
MAYDVDIVERQEQPSAVVRGNADIAHLPEFLGRAFGEVAALVQEEHLAFAGPPFGRFTPTGDGRFDVEAGFPVAGPVRPGGTVDVISLPGGLAAHTVHVGAYDGIAAAYEATASYVHKEGFLPNGLPWETYLDGPDVANPRTEVYFPIRQP